jgi:hypothetical protein
MALFFSSLVLLLLIAAAVTTIRRFLSGWKIYDLFLPGRIAIWVAGIFLLILGLLLMAAELIGKPGTKPADTIGAKVAKASGGAFLGGWVGGLAASYILQYFTAWALGPTPPVVVQPPPKDGK